MSRLVSVVVPTCARDHLLARCLVALDAQEMPAETYEVIVVDDARREATRRLVERWAERSRAEVRYIALEERRGPAAARNAGWRAARGAVIAFTDDDCVPSPRWLWCGVLALTCGADGAYGPIRVPLPHAPTDYERDASGLERSAFATANCFYRRRALAEVGGFDERFTTAWREDSDLYLELLERRRPLAYARDAVVVHPVRRARWGVSLRQQRKSMFNALLYKKHGTLYREHVQASPPWRYYGIVGALVASLAAAAASHVGGALALLGAWALLTASFCAQRLRDTSRAPSHVAEMIVTSALIPPLAVFWRLRGAVRFRVMFL